MPRMPTPTSKANGDARKRSGKAPATRGQARAGNIIDEIYQDDEGEDSLQTIDRRNGRSPRTLFIALGVLVLLVAAAVAGFFTFNRRQQFNEKGVSVRVETPSSVTSAGEATFTFTVENGEGVGINNVELSVAAPDGWTFKSSDPKARDPNNTLWVIGAIPGRGKGSVTVVGSLVGEVGSVKTFNATVTYRPANFNYDFTSKASGSVTISSSILELDLAGPTQVSPGAKATYTLTYTNTSDQALRDIRLIAVYPDDFSPSNLTPAPREGNNVWAIDELKSGGTASLSVEGTLAGNVGDSRQLTFTGELQRGSQRDKQVEATLVILLVQSQFQLSLSVNGASTKSAVAPAETLAYEFNYRNTSDLELTNVTITVALSGGGLDADSFSDDLGAKLKDGSVSWDTRLIPQLAALKPDASGTIRFSVKVLDVPIATLNAGGPTVEAQASVASRSGNASAQPMKTDRLVTKVTSRASLSVDPRYYDDDGVAVGSGPLPPAVGKTTTYRVSWYLGNSSNELKDVTVTGSVPSNVFWTGRNTSTTAGDLSFDAKTRVVTWKINKLPPGVGKDTPTLSASFQVSITPTSSDVGSSMKLLEVSTLKAHDSFADVDLTVKRDAVTTDLQTDPKALGQGVVVES